MPTIYRLIYFAELIFWTCGHETQNSIYSLCGYAIYKLLQLIYIPLLATYQKNKQTKARQQTNKQNTLEIFNISVMHATHDYRVVARQLKAHIWPDWPLCLCQMRTHSSIFINAKNIRSQHSFGQTSSWRQTWQRSLGRRGMQSWNQITLLQSQVLCLV